MNETQPIKFYGFVGDHISQSQYTGEKNLKQLKKKKLIIFVDEYHHHHCLSIFLSYVNLVKEIWDKNILKQISGPLLPNMVHPSTI